MAPTACGPRRIAATAWLLASLTCGIDGAAAQEGTPDATAAEAAWIAADFDGARAGFERVLASPGLDRAGAVRAHRFLAALAAVTGDEQRAAHHAELAVLLDPAAMAPEGAGSTRTLFDEARARHAGRAARLRIGVSARRATARLEPPAPPVIDRVQLACRWTGGSREVSGQSGAPVELPLPPDAAALECTASGITTAGASLLEARSAGGAGTSLTGRTDASAGGSGADGPVLWPWLLAGSAALVAIGVVIVLGAGGGDGGNRFGAVRVAGW